MMLNLRKSHFYCLIPILLASSCASNPTQKANQDICQMMIIADPEKLNTICQKLLDNGTDSIDVLLECLNSKSDLETPVVKLILEDHWEGQVYHSPQKICDLSLTLLTYILEKKDFCKLENTAALPIDDGEREKIISEFLDWFNASYKRH